LKRYFSVYVVIILITIFFLSILIRLPNINRPLSKHHEFVTAISLHIINIWQMDGAAKYNFNPVMTYPGMANKYINKYASTTGKMVDVEGNYYYVSHPPFAYILPYLVFQLLHVKATVIAIEIFHLVINFISALFIYLIICNLQFRKSFEVINWSGVCGFSVYLFSAGVLWFQCNTYMSDMLVHLFFLAAVYCLLQIFANKKQNDKYLFFYAGSLFLMIYTSWLGIFFAFSVILYSTAKLRKRIFIIINLITAIVSFMTITLFIYQYSLIDGLGNYWDQMKDRLKTRSGWTESSSLSIEVKNILNALLTILKNYGTSYLPFILLLGFFIYLLAKKRQLSLKISERNFLFIWTSVLPIILLHASLLDYSGHDFVSLYGSLFLSVAIALAFEKVRKNKVFPIERLRLLLFLSIVLSVATYYYINRPGKFSFKGDEYGISKQLGLKIKNTAPFDAVVFTIGAAEIDPQLMYYAERNIKEIKTKNEAFDFLKIRNIKHGIIYYSSNAKHSFFDKIEEINLTNKSAINN
jgi:hypothetical protein